MLIKRILFGPHSEKLKCAHYFITLLIRVSILIAIITSIVNTNWLVLFVSLIALVLTYLPKMIEKKYSVDIPIEFEIIIVIFIYAAIFLGEVKKYYARFWWWDIMLHTISGIALGFIGFGILLVLYKTKKIQASPFTIALFSLSFGIGMGAFWEIFEFTMDQLFNTNMQKNGLTDTMWDLIVDGIGALFASTIGYIYIKTGEIPIFKNLINKFIKENPKLFKK